VDGVDEAVAAAVDGVPDCAGVAADFDDALFELALFDEALFDEALFDDDALCVAVFAALWVVSCAVVPCAWSEAPANSTSAAATREMRFMRLPPEGVWRA